MSTVFVEGLQIMVIGMGLVFGALIMLWALMAIMTRLFPPRAPQAPALTQRPAEERAGLPPTDAELAAIAAALAVLRAEQELELGLGWRLPPVLTRWVAVGYGRQLRSWQPARRRRGE